MDFCKRVLEMLVAMFTLGALLIGAYAALPMSLKLATQGWVLERMGPQLNYVVESFAVRDISHFNRKRCSDEVLTHRQKKDLARAYRWYEQVNEGQEHDYEGRNKKYICEDFK